MIKLTEAQGAMLLSLVTQTGDESLINGIGAQITDQIDNPNHDKDLVDVVAKLVAANGQRARAFITDEKLNALRAAVFSPRELMKLKACMNVSNCVSCGRQLDDESLVTFLGGELYCSLCYTPTTAKCHGCGEAMSIYEALRNFIGRMSKKCKKCHPGKTAPSLVDDATELLQEPEALPAPWHLGPTPEAPPGIAELVGSANRLSWGEMISSSRRAGAPTPANIQRTQFEPITEIRERGEQNNDPL